MKSNRFLFVSVICCVLFAYFLQKQILFCGDVAYLLTVTELWWQGGKYTTDFFETNPPMILYLYLPGYLLSKLGLPLIQAMRFYLFTLGFFSLWFSWLYLKKIFIKNAAIFLPIMSIAIVFNLFFLPVNQFGQREHLLMIFLLPYLLLAVLRLHQQTVNTYQAFAIGLIAGCGVALKPFFVIPLFFIELYLALQCNLRIWLRIELLALIFVGILYLNLLYFFDANYIFHMLPLISHLYFIGMKEPWMAIFLHPVVIYCALVTACYFTFKQIQAPHLAKLILLVMWGMVAAFTVPRAPWFYHVMPAFGFACLLWAYYYAELWLKLQNPLTLPAMKDYLFICLAGLTIFALPLYINFLQFTYFINELKQGTRHKLIHYFQSVQGDRTISCFSVNTTEDCFPLVYASQGIYASRFPFLWWLRGTLVKQDKPYQQALIDQDKNYLLQKITEDFQHYKTQYVIINKQDLTNRMGKNFDVVAFLADYQPFAEIWKNYMLKKEIDYYQIYQRK